MTVRQQGVLQRKWAQAGGAPWERDRGQGPHRELREAAAQAFGALRQIGTVGTVSSGAYQRALQRLRPDGAELTALDWSDRSFKLRPNMHPALCSLTKSMLLVRSATSLRPEESARFNEPCWSS